MTDVSLLRSAPSSAGRDHSTVLHACDKITREVAVNDELRREIRGRARDDLRRLRAVAVPVLVRRSSAASSLAFDRCRTPRFFHSLWDWGASPILGLRGAPGSVDERWTAVLEGAMDNSGDRWGRGDACPTPWARGEGPVDRPSTVLSHWGLSIDRFGRVVHVAAPHDHEGPVPTGSTAL